MNSKLWIPALAAVMAASPALAESGLASIYAMPGDRHAWSRTANGERVDPNALTAAHKTISFNTRVTVVNQRTGAQVVVRINDRGPFVKGRVFDLTPAAAAKLGFRDGLIPVSVH